ncbi:MAG: lipoyl domain-containing protein [Candidatus Spyradocola sp.]|jgi:pyruvate/2-oxoglutarate dehydrogenase complex dihydrolipoamide acyltransferase (E2) component
MAVIQMPSRGKKDETGMITKWYKKTGDWVAEGDELFSFDTDDGSYTVKSQKAGRLVAIFVPEGELVHCPTDVGMLSSPSPDSVLKMGRMQFVDEEKPRVAPHADPEPVDPEIEPAAAPAPDAEPEAEPQPEAEEAPAAEPEAESQPEVEGEQEPQPEESPAPDEPEQVPADEQPEAEAAPDEPMPAPALTLDDEPEEAEAAPEESDIASEESEPSDSADAPAEGETEAEPEAPEAESAPAPAEAAARPASLTRRVDMAFCRDIAGRTGVSVAAMVRFAAMHAAPEGWLAPVEDGSLRGMSGRELPNVLDLSGWGVERVQRAGDGELCFLVPALTESVRRGGEGIELYPSLELTLCFDEARISLEAAARFLRDTCKNLESFWDLLL